jgi:uncharacterized damage-inducible protein DinB
MTPDYFRPLFEYDAAANRAMLAAARDTFAPDDRPAQILAHTVLSMQLWLLRLRHEYQGTETFWSDARWDLLADRIERNLAEVNDFLDAETTESLNAPIPYHNSKGERHANTPAEILQHVIIHGGYHRGQVARALRERGIDPPVTDFIRWARGA